MKLQLSSNSMLMTECGMNKKLPRLAIIVVRKKIVLHRSGKGLTNMWSISGTLVGSTNGELCDGVANLVVMLDVGYSLSGCSPNRL